MDKEKQKFIENFEKQYDVTIKQHSRGRNLYAKRRFFKHLFGIDRDNHITIHIADEILKNFPIEGLRAMFLHVVGYIRGSGFSETAADIYAIKLGKDCFSVEEYIMWKIKLCYLYKFRTTDINTHFKEQMEKKFLKRYVYSTRLAGLFPV